MQKKTAGLHKWSENADIAPMAQSSMNSTIHAFGPCSPQEVDAALAQAERIAKQRGQKMTRIRRKVLQLLLESANPSKAYDLLSKLDGEGAAKPPTIYRALDFLQEVGLAHKIESLNAYVACGHAAHKHAAIFLICTICGRAEELHTVATLSALQAETNAASFEMAHATIEAQGTCRNCRA